MSDVTKDFQLDSVEKMILHGLIFREQFARKVLPFIENEYFTSKIEKTIFTLIRDYYEEYGAPPTTEILSINIRESKKLNEDEVKEGVEYLSSINHGEITYNEEWLVNRTEQFCKDRALYNSVFQSINIINGEDKKYDRGAIPDILQQALSVSFNTDIGHDYLDDADKRFEFYHNLENRVPTDIESINKITRGGFPDKTLSVFVAGCVHPDTKIKVRYGVVRIDEETMIKEIRIGDLPEYLDDYEVEVEGEDGFVPVKEFVDKGLWEEWVVEDSVDSVRVNKDHLFETPNGWVPTKYLNIGDKIRKSDGTYSSVDVRKTGQMIPIVDLVIDHENHRYYANGFSSHNTNVGKTMVMTHLASGNLSLGYNVLYITMEIAEERIAERIDANLLDVPIHDLETIPKQTYDRKMEKLKQNVKGKLKIKEYPTAGANVNHLKSLLNELKIKQNFVPDIIYVDYMNIMSSSRMKMGGSVNSYSYVKAIAEELRGLAVEMQLPVVSATQTNKDGQNDMDFDMTNTSESHGTNMTADAIYGLISNEELQDKGMMLLKQLKTRYVQINYMRKFFIGVEFHKMRLYELENPLDGLTQTHMDTNDEKRLQGNSGRKKPSFDDFAFEDDEE